MPTMYSSYSSRSAVIRFNPEETSKYDRLLDSHLHKNPRGARLHRVLDSLAALPLTDNRYQNVNLFGLQSVWPRCPMPNKYVKVGYRKHRHMSTSKRRLIEPWGIFIGAIVNNLRCKTIGATCTNPPTTGYCNVGT